jgi:hypothetical protein
MEERVISTEEDSEFDAPLAVLESIALEKFIMLENFPPDQIRILLQPLLEDFNGVLLAPLVE